MRMIKNAKLDVEQVKEIYKIRFTVKSSAVAEMYGVHRNTVTVCSQAPHPDDNVARLIDVYITHLFSLLST